MKSEHILNSLGDVAEQYIWEAAPVGQTDKKAVRRTVQKRSPLKCGIAAACLCLAAATAGMGSIAAAGGLNKSFGQLFHTLSESHYEDILFDINQSITDNGVTVTLTQGMCDGKALYVIEKVEFDPSVMTLTDDLFNADQHSGTNTPMWLISDLVNVKKTDAYKHKDIGGVISREGGHIMLLEHDAHSITWLSIYGGSHMSGGADPFFTDGKQFTLRYRYLENLPGYDSENPYECQFNFDIEMEKISEPHYYTLPEEIYQIDYYAEAADKSLVDVTINPWFISFSAGTGTGKILDTSLKSSDRPSLEITLNDGTVYTERNGIDVASDYFGADYDQTDFVRFGFDTPIDVTDIKSIKIYGHALKKGIVAPDKERVMSEDRGKRQLPAHSPVLFSKEFTELETVDYEGSTGHIQYRINSVDVYDNLYATGADKSVIDFRSLENEEWRHIRYDDNGQLIQSNYAGTYDAATGQLADGYYLLEFEVEVTNTDANNQFSGGTFNYADTYIFNKFFSASQYDKYSNRADKSEGLLLVYLKEDEVQRTGQYGDFKLEKGATKKLHVGFLLPDNNAGGLEQIAFSVGWAHGIEEAHTLDTVYFNAAKIVKEFEAAQKNR